MPLFTGWYSKDAILAESLAFGLVSAIAAFAAVPAAAGDGRDHRFYMFRMWFMTFTGEPTDHHVLRARPRIAAGDDGAADRSGGVQRVRRPGVGRCGMPRSACSASILRSRTAAGR